MAPARTVVAVLALLVVFACHSVDAFRKTERFCQPRNCYSVIGVKEEATKQEIQKTYRKLAAQYHPDKNADAPPSFKQKYEQLGEAYEILSNDTRRREYDYALAHPEEFAYVPQEGFFAATYREHVRVHPAFPIVGLLLGVSLIEYFVKLNAYKETMRSRKRDPKVQSLIKRRREELNLPAPTQVAQDGGKGGKGKRVKKDVDLEYGDDEVVAVVALFGSGARKPKWWELIAIQVLLSPIQLVRDGIWELRWFWRYTIQRQEYSRADAAYLTYTKLEMPVPKWDSMTEAAQEELLAAKLWIKENFQRYEKRNAKGQQKESRSRRRRPPDPAAIAAALEPVE